MHAALYSPRRRCSCIARSAGTSSPLPFGVRAQHMPPISRRPLVASMPTNGGRGWRATQTRLRCARSRHCCTCRFNSGAAMRFIASRRSFASEARRASEAAPRSSRMRPSRSLGSERRCGGASASSPSSSAHRVHAASYQALSSSHQSQRHVHITLTPRPPDPFTKAPCSTADAPRTSACWPSRCRPPTSPLPNPATARASVSAARGARSCAGSGARRSRRG